MSIAGIQTPESEKPNVADRIVDAARHAAHISHEARLVKSLALRRDRGRRPRGETRRD